MYKLTFLCFDVRILLSYTYVTCMSTRFIECSDECTFLHGLASDTTPVASSTLLSSNKWSMIGKFLQILVKFEKPIALNPTNRKVLSLSSQQPVKILTVNYHVHMFFWISNRVVGTACINSSICPVDRTETETSCFRPRGSNITIMNPPHIWLWYPFCLTL